MTALLQQLQELQCEFFFASYGDKSFLSPLCSIICPPYEQNFKRKILLVSLYVVEVCLTTNNYTVTHFK